MNMIGSESFTIKRTGTTKGDYNQQLNQYLIESTDIGTSQYLYIDEYHVNELIDLLEKVKELL